LKHEEFLARNQDLIDKFLEIAERKVSVLDDYGDEHWDVLPGEVKLCLKKIVQREGLTDKWNEGEHWAKAAGKRYNLYGGKPYGKEAELRNLVLRLPEEYRELDKTLTKLFEENHEYLRAQVSEQTDLDSLSGPEFEMHIAKLLRSAGYDVAGTPKTGDQGADLVAKKDGKTIIVQAKRYQGPVGNKAVQEVISAVSFYGGDEGWVVTNSTFTASAKALAQKAGIRLIDGRALRSEQL
jgi:Restriction endonuclease